MKAKGIRLKAKGVRDNHQLSPVNSHPSFSIPYRFTSLKSIHFNIYTILRVFDYDFKIITSLKSLIPDACDIRRNYDNFQIGTLVESKVIDTSDI